MKLSESNIKRIIREELRILNEITPDIIDDPVAAASLATTSGGEAGGDVALTVAEVALGFTPVGIAIDAAYLAKAILDRDPAMAAIAGIAFIPGVGDALAAPARAGLRQQRLAIREILQQADEALEPAQRAQLRRQADQLRGADGGIGFGRRASREVTRTGITISKFSGALRATVESAEEIMDGALDMVSRSGDELSRLSQGGTARLSSETAEELLAPLADAGSELQVAYSKLNVFKGSSDFAASDISREALEATQRLYAQTSRELAGSVDDILLQARRPATEAFQQAGEEVTEVVVREAKGLVDIYNHFVDAVKSLRRGRGARNTEPGWLRRNGRSVLAWLTGIGLGGVVTMEGAQIVGDWQEARERISDDGGEDVSGGGSNTVDRTGDGTVDTADTGVAPAIDYDDD